MIGFDRVAIFMFWIPITYFVFRVIMTFVK